MSYYGTNRDDVLNLSVGDLAGDYVNGRRGYDVLALSSDGDYSFSRSSYYCMRKIEEIDFSGFSGAIDIVISGSMLRQAQCDVLTMKFADTGPINLTAKAYTGGSLLLDGAGPINLADGENNTVALKDGATLEIHGGAGNDTITAGTGGMMLDGGGGNDALMAGAGADIVRFAIGFGTDTVYGVDVADDVVSLEGFGLTHWSDVLSLASQEFSDTVLAFGSGASLHLDGVTLAELTADNFLVDGVVPETGPPTITISLGTSAADLNAQIAAAEDGTTFVMEAGNHVFGETILIARDNVTLTGEENADVTITFDFQPGTGGDGIVVQGGDSQYVSTLPDGAAAGDNTLTLRDSHGFSAGDTIYVQQPNTQDYLDASGWTNVSMAEAEFRPFRESIHEIESVDEKSITLKTPLSYDLAAGEGRYYSLDAVSGVTLSGFTLTYNLGATDTYDFSNTQSAFKGTSALLLENTTGVSVSNIQFIDVASTGLNLSSTINADISDILVSGSHNKGGGGNGYGVELHEAFNNTLSGLELLDVRHAVVLSAWHAETDNVVEVTNTNRDINLHGSSDHANTIHVSNSVLDYDAAGGGPVWDIVSGGGTNHAATDISANSVTFTQGIASDGNDTLSAADGGSVLYGGFGYDTLAGSSGADVIIGGTRRDTMTGGEGQDTFLLTMGDDLDRITDFEFGVDGDTLIFSGNVAVQDASDLTISAYGDHVKVRYGSNSTVILENTTVADVGASNFEFDPTGDLTVDDFLIF